MGNPTMRRPAPGRHPAEGVLRRLVDEPDAVRDDERAHVGSCPACAAGLSTMRADAAAVAASLSTDDGPATQRTADLDAAWTRLVRTTAAGPAPRSVPPTRPRGRLSRPALAAAVAAVVLTGAGVAAAADWLPVFSTQRVAPVPVSTAELVQLPDLSRYGDSTTTGTLQPHTVADAGAARGASGLQLPEVGDLPSGVTGDPQYEVVDKATVTFTFSAAKAAAAAAEAGQTPPPVPAGLDGSRVRLTVGPGAAEVWAGPAGLPSLIVARVVGPTIDTSGVPYDTVRDYLLSLPGLSPDLAAQLRSLSADGGTLPLPVPADQVTTSSAEVGGLPATVLTSRNGTMGAVVWVDSGVVTGVAGMLPRDRLVAVAQQLR
jgi:hypothetical protein